jgi:hypothetical protein
MAQEQSNKRTQLSLSDAIAGISPDVAARQSDAPDPTSPSGPKPPPLPGAGPANLSTANPGTAALHGMDTVATPNAPSTGSKASEATKSAKAPTEPSNAPASDSGIGSAVSDGTRRQAKRRAAGPSREKVAANDDIPTIGGLIYALEQKPSSKPFKVATGVSVAWFIVGCFFAWGAIAPQVAASAGIADLLAKPIILIMLATIFLPIVLFWFLAWLLYQAQDLRLRSSAMTEVAIRLAEPDRNAEHAVASLGQSVRKQVNFMNEAVSRAIGRAGELEAMVHNEVATLDQSFSNNEIRIRGVLDALAKERNELTSTSDQVHTTLRAMGDEVPALIEKLNSQQIKLAKIIEGAGQNLIALESSLTKASDHLEGTVGEKTIALQAVLTDNVGQIHTAITDGTARLNDLLSGSTGDVQGVLVDRTNHLQTVLDEYTQALHASLGARTGEFQTVFEEFTLALDSTLAGRAQSLDTQLVDRTRALDAAFAGRLQAFDDSVRQSTLMIDSTIGEKAQALSIAMETHARQLADTLGRQSQNLDEQLMQGISAVRRTSENITRQSVKAIEGLSGQADMLKTVSENLLTQIGGVTTRFENQGQSIMRAANALETANYRIDQTLQNRHRELNSTLGALTGTTEQLGQQMLTYKTSLEGSLTEAQQRAKLMTEDLARGAQSHAQQALSELERLKADTNTQTSRAINDLRDQFSNVTREVSAQVGSLSNRLTETSDDLRNRAQQAAQEFEREQELFRQQAARLPDATRESAEAMRRVLQDQMRALEQISSLAAREGAQRDITPPAPLATHVQQPHMPVQTPAAYNAPLPTHMPQQVALPHPSAAATFSNTLAEQAQAASRAAATHTPVHQSPNQNHNRWSLGDLLARASVDEIQTHQHVVETVPQQGHAGPAINLENIARALDPQTAAAIWARFRSGQRGIMVRSIYTAEGRATFDEVKRRFVSDPDFRGMVERFLADFERLLQETEQKDRTGQLLQAHLTSNSGRVYLFLAHASGRLT